MPVEKITFEAFTLASAFADRTAYRVQLIFGKVLTSDAKLKGYLKKGKHWGIAIQANGYSDFSMLRDSLASSVAESRAPVFVTELTNDRFYVIGDLDALLLAVERGWCRHRFFQTNTPEEIREVLDSLRRGTKGPSGLVR